MINTASEEALLAQVLPGRAPEPVLFFYTPHAIFTRFDLAQVELPACTKEEHEAKVEAGAVDCAYPEDRLIKIFNPQLKESAPDAYSLLKGFNYTTDDQIENVGDAGCRDDGRRSGAGVDRQPPGHLAGVAGAVERQRVV